MKPNSNYSQTSPIFTGQGCEFLNVLYENGEKMKLWFSWHNFISVVFIFQYFFSPFFLSLSYSKFMNSTAPTGECWRGLIVQQIWSVHISDLLHHEKLRTRLKKFSFENWKFCRLFLDNFKKKKYLTYNTSLNESSVWHMYDNTVDGLMISR